LIFHKLFKENAKNRVYSLEIGNKNAYKSSMISAKAITTSSTNFGLIQELE
jgi:hypothetical protein